MSEKSLAVIQQETRMWLEAPERQGELRKALPEGMTPEAFVRAVMTAHLRNDKLIPCSIESKWLAIMEAAQLGLMLNGVQAALVPFGRQAQLIVMYQGYIQLAYRHPRVLAITANTVHAKDHFKVSYGNHPRLEHTPVWSMEQMTTPRGDYEAGIIGAYATAHIQGGGRPFVYLTREEIEQHRQRSRAKDSGPWVTDWPAMAKKTAVLQLRKFIPQSAQLMQAVALEQEPEEKPLPEPYVPGDKSVVEILDAIAEEESVKQMEVGQ